MVVRTLQDQDLEFVDGVLSAGFGRPSVRWPDVKQYIRWQPQNWLMAHVAGRPAGMVGALDYGAFAYVGMMAVIPEARRRGLGRALMTELLSRLDAAGCPVVRLDATDMGAPLYLRFGFADDDLVHVYARETQSALGASRRPPAHVRALKAGDLEALAALDAPIFGADRRPVLQWLLNESPARSLGVWDAAGALSGYLLAPAARIGPWAAVTLEDAELLLAAALTLPDAPTSVIIPGLNAAGAALLVRHGFTLQRTLRHMRRGGAGVPGNRTKYYGQTSFAIG